MTERDDHRTGDNRWSNPRTRAKAARTEQEKNEQRHKPQNADAEPWPTPIPNSDYQPRQLKQEK